MEWPVPANTSMPLLITGGVVSLLATAAPVDTAVVVVGERDPLLVGAAADAADDDGEGDLPLIGGCCVAVGEVLDGERLDIDGGLLLLLLPSLALAAPCS